jgi:hypothetical protein
MSVWIWHTVTVWTGWMLPKIVRQDRCENFRSDARTTQHQAEYSMHNAAYSIFAQLMFHPQLTCHCHLACSNLSGSLAAAARWARPLIANGAEASKGRSSSFGVGNGATAIAVQEYSLLRDVAHIRWQMSSGWVYVNLSKTNDVGVLAHATCTSSAVSSNYTLKSRRNAIQVTVKYASGRNNW